MKNFFLGVLSAVLTGAILFFGERYYASLEADNQFNVVAETKLTLDFSAATLAKLTEEAKKNGDEIKFRYFRTANIGDRPIAGQSIFVQFDDPILYGSVVIPGGNPDNVSIFHLNPAGVTVDYRLFGKGEYHDFWIAGPGSEIDGITTKSPMLTVKHSPEFGYASEGIDIMRTILLLIGALAILSIGFGAAEVYHRRELKKRGIDLKAVLASPPTLPAAPSGNE